jgi:hypothetical protein
VSLLVWWWCDVVAGLGWWWWGRGVVVLLLLLPMLYMLVTALWSLPPWLYSRYTDPKRKSSSLNSPEAEFMNVQFRF